MLVAFRFSKYGENENNFKTNNMKIEIEFEAVESLKREISMLQKDKIELEEKLKSLDESELKKQANDLARKIFGDVMNRIFEELGFEDKTWLNDVDFGNLQHYLGANWWNSERLNIELGVTIINQFKGAFLRMGIKMENDALLPISYRS